MHLLQRRQTPGLLAGVPALNIRLMLKGMTNRKTDRAPMNDKKRVTLSRRRLLTGAVANSAFIAAPVIVRAQAPALKIAVLLPRSGYLAQAGQACYRGAVISPKVLADYGYKVELVHVDTESSADIARTQAERAINEWRAMLASAPFDSARRHGDCAGVRAASGAASSSISRPRRSSPSRATSISCATSRPAGSCVSQRAHADQGSACSHQGRAEDRRVPARQRHIRHGAARRPWTRSSRKRGCRSSSWNSIAYDPKAQDLSVEVTKIRRINPISSWS